VSAARVSRRANVLRRRAEMRQVGGPAEAGRQEAGDQHLADLEEQRAVSAAPGGRGPVGRGSGGSGSGGSGGSGVRWVGGLAGRFLPGWFLCRGPGCHTPPEPAWRQCSEHKQGLSHD